jgi:hypothetical protein
MCLQYGFVIFWPKDFGAKAAHKMLVKLTPDWSNSKVGSFFPLGDRSFREVDVPTKNRRTGHPKLVESKTGLNQTCG